MSVNLAHGSLKAAAAKVLKATWQRCRVHFIRNALAHAGKRQRQMVLALINNVFTQERSVEEHFPPRFVAREGAAPARGALGTCASAGYSADLMIVNAPPPHARHNRPR